MKESEYPRCMTCPQATHDKPIEGGEYLYCPKLKRRTGMIINPHGRSVAYRCSPTECPRKVDAE